MAEAKEKLGYGEKQQRVKDLYKSSPHLSNDTIAKAVGCCESYVYRLVGPNRTQGDVKRRLAALNKAKGTKKFTWDTLKTTRSDFVKTFLPTKEHKGETDFSNYMLPTDDQFESSGSGEDLSGSWSQYEYLSERRIGIGPKITRVPAEDAVREGFKILNKKTGKEEERVDIQQWLDDTDFLNELAKCLYYERVYGVGFLVYYFGKNDKEDKKLGKKIGKSEKKIVAFEALPPTILSPINSYESRKLDKDPQMWDLMGGYINPQKINHERVRVIMTREKTDRWYGLSVWEPIWDSAIPYYQALIFLLRGFSKWGNHLVKFIIPEELDIDALYTKHADIIDEMNFNGVYIGPTGSDIGFESTQLATGLREMMDIWIEDISAGVGMPVPLLMGRVVAQGLGEGGYAVMERYYFNTIKKIQRSITDDVIAILKLSGFELKGQKIDWNLTASKTDEQRYADDKAKKELDLMEIEIDSQKINKDLLELQKQDLQLELDMKEEQFLTTLLNPEQAQEGTTEGQKPAKTPTQKADFLPKESQPAIVKKLYEIYERRGLIPS